MTPLARGPLPIVVLLLAATAATVWSAALGARRWESCQEPLLLEDTGAIPGSVPDATRGFDSEQAFMLGKGVLQRHTVSGSELLYRVVRSDAAMRVAMHPTGSLKMPLDPDRRELRWSEVDGERIPFHVVSAGFGRLEHVAVYFLEYDGRAVESLLPLQIATAPAQLLRGTRPISLYIVEGLAQQGRAEEVLGPATAWLEEAWRRHRQVCRL